MTLLKQITMDGQIRYGYAHMTVTYIFSNPCGGVVSPRFVFPMPEGGRILGFQFLSPEGRLLRASVCPLTEEKLSQSGIRLCQVSRVMYALLWEGMNPEEELQILLELLLPLAPREAGFRLVFPLTGDESIKDCAVALQLYTGQAGVKGASPSHNIRFEEENGETVVSGQFMADRDFVLDCRLPLDSSSGMIQEQPQESIGIYRLCTANPKQYCGRKKQRLLLLPDWDAGTQIQRWRMIKELCYRVVQALPEGMYIQLMGDKPLFEDFLSVGEETLTRVFDALAEIPKGGAPWEKLQIDKDTLVLMISDGEEREAVQLPCNPQVHLMTLGNAAFSPLAEHWRRMEYGKHIHFYPEDVTETKVQQAVERLLVSGAPVQVTAYDGGAQELFLLLEHIEDGGYLDVAARFTGRAPRSFQLWQDGAIKETVPVDEITYYTHLPMAQKLYAGEKIQRLEALLKHTDAGTIGTVKKQIEDLSVRYETLSKETMLSIPDRQGGKQGIPVQLGFLGNGMTPRRTIFGERNNHAGQKEREKECLAILRKSIRSNGGVYDDDALSVRARKEQTGWAVLALMTVKEKDRAFLPVIISGEAYLKDCVLGGKVGWLYEKRDALKTYQKELWDCLSDLPEEIQGVKAAAQHLLWLFTA